MGIDEERFSNLSGQSRAWLRQGADQKMKAQAIRDLLDEVGDSIDAVRVVPGGRASDVDKHFAETFLPSEMVRTQLRLAQHYLKSALRDEHPTLSSFVVLRVAIECMATAHWLIASPAHRIRVERFLKRMWWDTQSTVEMTEVAGVTPDLSSVYDLEDTIHEIAEPIKGLDPEKIISSVRVRLSDVVQEASKDVRPSYPTLMQSAWMVCAGVSHGNIPMSAGIGMDAHAIRNPATHAISTEYHANFLEITVDDLQSTVKFFQQYATEEHRHKRPKS